METPDITPIQVRAVILWVISLLSLFGIAVGEATSGKIIALAMGFVTALPIMLVYADAVIRRARANNLTAIMQSKLNAPSVQTPGPSYVEGEEG